MFAIVSDIHGNLEALDAVLADIARHPVSAIYCLGDLVGYGPNPVECVERAMKWDVVLLGFFDQAFLTGDLDMWGAESAATSLMLTRSLLPDTTPGRAFIAERPCQHHEGDLLFVLGSARNPLHEYLYPEDIDDLNHSGKLRKIAALVQRYCFCGNTHIPGVFVEPVEASARWQHFTPEQAKHFWRFDGRKTILNVGSVGQPRDGDWRACYVTVDGWDVTWHRVPYDVDTTVTKIYAIPELDNFLGDRLREGR